MDDDFHPYFEKMGETRSFQPDLKMVAGWTSRVFVWSKKRPGWDSHGDRVMGDGAEVGKKRQMETVETCIKI